MAHQHVLMGAEANRVRPTVRIIGLRDLKDALARGIADFSAMPTHAVFLCLIYPIVGLLLARLTLGYEVLPLLFPLAAGFALLGPFAAIGLYELSRRREQGLDASWQDAFDVLRSPSRGAIAALGLLLLAIFVIWIAVAQAIYIANFGYEPAASIPDFLHQVFTTPAGWMLIIVGNLVGFLFALAVLTISVVSFPLLLDRDVGRGRSGADIGARGGGQPLDDGDLGVDRRRLAGDRLLAVLLRVWPSWCRCSAMRPGTSIARSWSRIPEPHQELPRPQRSRRYAAQFPAAPVHRRARQTGLDDGGERSGPE